MSHSIVLGPDRNQLVLLVEGEHARQMSAPPPTADEVVDCTDATIMPGHVNAHTHLYSGLCGLAMPAPEVPPTNFIEILQRVWWRLDRALDEASLRAAARLAVAQGLLKGTTTFVDHHESPAMIDGSLEIVAEACRELGARAILSYGITERNDGIEEARRGLAENRRFEDANRTRRIQCAVGLHASFTLSDTALREAGELARDLGVVVHAHVAEDVADVADAQTRGFSGPLERLLALKALPVGSIVAHGVHLGPSQIRRGVDAGVWFVQNPRSNRANKVGYPMAFRNSTRVALGTDGFRSDMDAEAKVLWEEALARDDDPAQVKVRLHTGRSLTTELFRERFELPSSKASAVAEFRVVDDRGVRHVVSGGKLVVRDRKLAVADMAEIEADAREQATRLWNRMRAL